MDADQVRALRLIESNPGKALTEVGNALISRHAPALLRMGLIDYANTATAYKLNAAGREALKEAA